MKTWDLQNRLHSFSGIKRAPQTVFQFSALLENIIIYGTADYCFGEVSPDIEKKLCLAVLWVVPYWLQHKQGGLQD